MKVSNFVHQYDSSYGVNNSSLRTKKHSYEAMDILDYLTLTESHNIKSLRQNFRGGDSPFPGTMPGIITALYTCNLDTGQAVKVRSEVGHIGPTPTKKLYTVQFI